MVRKRQAFKGFMMVVLTLGFLQGMDTMEEELILQMIPQNPINTQNYVPNSTT
jgi:hypothetical protein